MSDSFPHARSRALACIALSLLIALVGLVCPGCGGEGLAEGGDHGVSASEGTAAAPSVLGGVESGPVDAVVTGETVSGDNGARQPGGGDTTSPTGVDPALVEVFARLAHDMHPLVVYGPSHVPAGADLADRWWPMLQYATPEEYGGDLQTNPRAVDDGHGVIASAEVLIQVGSGWLLLFQNLRGDLGDVAGEQVGIVDGQAALLYRLGDLAVVQWSRDGAWYGVGGRGIPASEVIRVGLGMIPLRYQEAR